ncbi:pyridoxal phosphate-dependent aminotransferase [Ascidiimonas aurantiaca]|uniref:pyridoxal phosphate-dependent aminotransferase n=1 Tax=Ascidiimonas aurantiaca TaxID=1685432 RepID=UPI0030EF5BEF
MIHKAHRLNTIEEYYFSKKLKEVSQLAAAGKPIINMGIGSPDLPPAQMVIKAIQQAVTEPGAHQYQSYQGLPQTRQAMADFYQTHFDVVLDPDREVLPLMGSKEGIMHISMAFLNEGDEVLIPDPGYPTYTSVTHLLGAVPRYYDLTEKTGWLPDLEALETMDLSRVKLMWVNYPHMPTGARADLSFCRKLIQFAAKNQILLVNDNPYSFILNDEPLSLLKADPGLQCVLELNSLSKTFNMAGWRIGMVAGHSEYLKAILKVKSNMDSGMFYGIQKGAVEALSSASEWFNSLNAMYRSRRDGIFEIASRLGCSFDSKGAGMFVWAKLPDGVPSSEQFIDALLYDKNIFITPGTVFGKNGEGYIRFSLCVKEEQIEEAMGRL